LPFEIRPALESDAADIAGIYAPIVSETAVSFEDVPPTADEMGKRIAATRADGYPYLVASNGKRILGYAYCGAHRSRAAYRYSADVTIYIAPKAQRSGVGRALYGALLPELARLGFHAAFAGIALPNPASIGLHEAVGFTLVGIYREVGFKFGRWHDVGWWQRLLAKG
jgi:L-amino acid N-acyltransferase YncA